MLMSEMATTMSNNTKAADNSSEVSSELPVGSSAATHAAKSGASNVGLMNMLPQASTSGAHASSASAVATSNANTGTNVENASIAASNKATFLEKVRQSNAACQTGDFALAISLYTEAIRLDPANHILYSNRSAAHVKLGQFGKALQDAVKAKQLNPEWPKAYYRQGVALQCLGRHAEALAAFSNGLAQDPKSLQLLAGLIEAAMKSPLKTTLEPTYRQLKAMKLDGSPFVIISVIGQELLAQGKYGNAVEVLESALKIGTCSLKLRGSVFSALSSAYWALNSLDKAIGYMQQDLVVAKSLNDIGGECRAHGNMGAAHFSKGNFKEALTSHRYQLVLAMKCKDSHAAASALTSLGHVYTAIGDYQNALASHKQCVDMVRTQLNDKLQEAREIGNVGAVYLAMGDFDRSVECHMEHLTLAQELGNKVEEARAFSNLGSSHHYKRSFEQATIFHNNVLRLAHQLSDKSIEARAYAGLGHASRCMGNNLQAKEWYEKQLQMALLTKDRIAEGRACSNLGIVYQLFGDHDAALKLHQAHLNIARQMSDKAAMGRAYGNIGNAYSASGLYDQAVKYHKQELTISKEVGDRTSEASTHGNLAVAYQALGSQEMALVHYHSHLNIARELKDVAGEACALCNLGNCHSSRGEFAQAVPFYENYLMLSQELNDVEGEGKACHFLGYAHYCLGNFKEAIRYYDQDLALARDQQDRSNMSRAYCNLGLAHLAIGNCDSALECQKYFLAIADSMKETQSRFRALGNMGDVLIKMEQVEEAIKVYQKQLTLSKQTREKTFEATAYGSLGVCHRLSKQFDKALGYHTQELSILQDLGDVQGECKAHGHLGAVHLSLSNYINSVKCYTEQLERAREVRDHSLEAAALGNLGVAKLNLGRHEEAIICLDQQLKSLEQMSTLSNPSNSQTISETTSGMITNNGGNLLTSTDLEQSRAFGNLGSCYEALGNYDKAAQYYEQYLALSLKTKNVKDQDRAYRDLGSAHKNLGNLQQALVCFEKRLVVAHDLCQPVSAKGSAYGELGEIHALLGNYEQAASCLEHQLHAARDSSDKKSEAKAASSLGNVHNKMNDNLSALQFHQLDLDISSNGEHSNGAVDYQGQIRALRNLGATYEAMDKLNDAIALHERHLAVATQNDDILGKADALNCLGRLHHITGELDSAISFLQQGLTAAESSNVTPSVRKKLEEDEARIRHRLGLVLWQTGQDLDEARQHLDQSATILETIRRQPKHSTEKLDLYDLQTECYELLQRILVTLERENEALIIAERARTRAFIDLLYDRKANSGKVNQSNNNTANSTKKHSIEPCSPSSVAEVVNLVNRQKASVLYYSIAAGFLYSWLIVPTKGIVKFHQVSLQDDGDDKSEDDDELANRSIELKDSSKSMLENHVHNIRASLGVDSTTTNDDTDMDGDMWSSHLDALGDRLNQEGDRSGFLRMVNRSSKLNASSYSLSSLFSVGSVNCGSTISGAVSRQSARGSTAGGKRNPGGPVGRALWQGPSSLRALYKLLLEPMEEDLPEGFPCELVLVLEGDLYLVPFSMLRGSVGSGSSAESTTEYLCERYSLLIAPSLTAIKTAKSINKNVKTDQPSSALIVGNPKMPSSVSEHWGWNDIPYSAQEADTVAEIMQSSSMTGDKATKEAIISQLSQAECIHLACHVSWKLSAIVLSPGEYVESKSSGNSPPSAQNNISMNKKYTSIQTDTIHEENDSESSQNNSNHHNIGGEMASTIAGEMPALSEFLLTAGDILNLKLSNAKLVVISSCYTRDEQHGNVTSDGLIALTRALLAAGAQCVLVSLWPVPDTAVKLIMKALYSSLLQGARVSRALADAMTTVQNTKHFQHPANWAGFILVGSDVKLSNKVALMGQALRDILGTPESCRDAFRVTLHLVEKSLQRIHRGYRNAMYTSQKSIENKVGGDSKVKGWKDLLISVGFRFEPATNGIPSSVFFPQSDPGERLTQCSASLQAILGLNQSSWSALSKLLLSSSNDSSDEIIALFRQVVVLMSNRDPSNDNSFSRDVTISKRSNDFATSVEVPVNVKLWRVPGCHELLASLGFDLMEVVGNKQDVILKTSKQANKRQIQYALQVMLALFETQDAPRSLDVDDDETEDETSSDMEVGDDYEDDDDIEDDEVDMENNRNQMIHQQTKPFGNGGLILDMEGHSSAFTSYVRKRGEPDGRQAGNGDSPTQPSVSTILIPKMFQNQNHPPQPSIPPPPIPPIPNMALYQNQDNGISLSQHKKGHESDCNFTPSPVEPRNVYGSSIGQVSKMFGTLPSDQGSPITSKQHIHSHGHQHVTNFVAHSFGAQGYATHRPESTSSAGSSYGRVEDGSGNHMKFGYGHHYHGGTHHHGHHTLAGIRQQPQIIKGGQHNTRHSHHGAGSVQQRINQALDLISSDVANVSGMMQGVGSTISSNKGGIERPGMSMLGNIAPLYENSAMEFSARQPAGKPVTPIRSVFTDVGYHSNQRKIIQDTSDPNDKFSVRTEIKLFGNSAVNSNTLGQASTASTTSVNSASSSNTASTTGGSKRALTAAEIRLNPGVIKRVPPTGESCSPEMKTKTNKDNKVSNDKISLGSMQRDFSSAPMRNTTNNNTNNDHSQTEQNPNLRTSIAENVTLQSNKHTRKGLNQLPIVSEVYHERNVGLDMAPPLSKLILSSNLQVVQVDHHSDSESSSTMFPLSPVTSTSTSSQQETVAPRKTNSGNGINTSAQLELPPLLPHPQVHSQNYSINTSKHATQDSPKGPINFDASLKEDSLNCFDNLSVIEEAHQRNSIASSSTARTVIIKDDPPSTTILAPQPSLSQVHTMTYAHPDVSLIANIKNSGPSLNLTKRRPPVPPKSNEPSTRFGIQNHIHTQQQPQASPWYKVSGRDDGDGRSMTDSQYSGYSPNSHFKNRLQIPNNTPTNPTSTPNTSLASHLSYMKLKDYMNDQEITVLEEKELKKPEAGMTPIPHSTNSFGGTTQLAFSNNPANHLTNKPKYVPSQPSSFVSPTHNSRDSSNVENSEDNFGMKMKPLEVAHYINSQFKMPPPSSPSNSLNTVGLPQSPSTSVMSQQQQSPRISPAVHSPQQGSTSFARDTKHPQQLWSRTRNGGLTYTGLFSSDC